MSGLWVKMAAAYDSHWKIVAVGFEGWVVHQFLIRQSKLHGLRGRLPAPTISPAYIAAALRIGSAVPDAEGFAARGVEACIRHGLIKKTDDGSAEIHDWEDWQVDGSAAERMRRLRARQAPGQQPLPGSPPAPPERSDRQIDRSDRVTSRSRNNRATVENHENDTSVTSRSDPVTGVTRTERNVTAAGETLRVSLSQEFSELYERAEKRQVHIPSMVTALDKVVEYITCDLKENRPEEVMRLARAIWMRFTNDTDPYLVSRHHDPTLILNHGRIARYYEQRRG